MRQTKQQWKQSKEFKENNDIKRLSRAENKKLGFVKEKSTNYVPKLEKGERRKTDDTNN